MQNHLRKFVNILLQQADKERKREREREKYLAVTLCNHILRAELLNMHNRLNKGGIRKYFPSFLRLSIRNWQESIAKPLGNFVNPLQQTETTPTEDGKDLALHSIQCL